MIRETAAAVAPGRPWLLRRRLGVAAPSRRLALVIAYAAVALPGLCMALLQPVWQITDEAQHYDVIAQYAHGVYPVEGLTTLRPETVGVMVATGNYRWSPPQSVPRPAIVDPAQFGPPPAYLSGYDFRLWVRRHIWWFSYEAMQPPLFYALAAPAWAVADHVAGPFAAVFSVRLLNAVLLGLLGPLALAGAWLLAPGRRWLGPVAVAVTAAMPGLLLNGTQVTNDTLGAVFGSATVLVAASALRSGWTARRAALLGLLLGATLLTKLTAIGLAVGLAVALALPAVRQSSLWRRQTGYAAVVAAVCGVVLAPWFALDLAAYGHPVPTSEAARLLGAGTSGSRYWIWQSLDYCYATFWTGEHRNTLPYTGLFEILMLVFGIGAAVGVLRLLRRRGWLAVQPAVLAVLLAAVLGQWVWAMLIPYAGGLGGMTPGRYLYPAVVPALLLVVAGGMAVLRRNAGVALCAALFVAMSALNFTAYAQGQTAVSHEARSGPPASGSLLVVDGEGTYRGVSIAADRIATDSKKNSIWVHIHVQNSSPLSADWWPAASATMPGGVRGGGDYMASTPFPETLAGGAEYWGWIRVKLPPSQLRPGATLTLKFPDVAANHYRDVDALLVTLTLPQSGVGGSGNVTA